jgi:hypothetical protein
VDLSAGFLFYRRYFMLKRDFIRLATKLLPLWQKQDHARRSQELFLANEIEAHLREIKACESRLNLTIKHSWQFAQAELKDQALLAYRRLRILLQDKEDDARLDPPRDVRLSDLCGDLVQLQEEFAQVTIDWKNCTLSAQTEPIVLQGIQLGSFAIQFHWRLWPQHEEVACWSVEALQPHSSRVNPAVTHPHINGEEICLGEAAIPIMKALRDGRLAEAFLLINAVLTQYNAESAYVRLEEWGGVVCHDCGAAIGDDSHIDCGDCGHYFCRRCSSSCARCDIERCLGCLTKCALCDDACCRRCLEASSASKQEYCRRCLERCAGCEYRFAPDEIEQESRLCGNCRGGRRLQILPQFLSPLALAN